MESDSCAGDSTAQAPHCRTGAAGGISHTCRAREPAFPAPGLHPPCGAEMLSAPSTRRPGRPIVSAAGPSPPPAPPRPVADASARSQRSEGRGADPLLPGRGPDRGGDPQRPARDPLADRRGRRQPRRNARGGRGARRSARDAARARAQPRRRFGDADRLPRGAAPGARHRGQDGRRRADGPRAPAASDRAADRGSGRRHEVQPLQLAGLARDDAGGPHRGQRGPDLPGQAGLGLLEHLRPGQRLPRAAHGRTGAARDRAAAAALLLRERPPDRARHPARGRARRRRAGALRRRALLALDPALAARLPAAPDPGLRAAHLLALLRARLLGRLAVPPARACR